MDTINYVNDNNPKAREALKENVSELNLTDIWRFIYPDKKDYTWTQPHSFKQGRIDFYLISENLVKSIKNANIKTGYKTDHRLITLEISFNENIPGRGYWKFNSSLLQDKEYVNQVKKVIKETTETYAVPIYIREKVQDIKASEIQFIIDDHFLEVLLMNIRGKTISYGSWKKRNRGNKKRS